MSYVNSLLSGDLLTRKVELHNFVFECPILVFEQS